MTLHVIYSSHLFYSQQTHIQGNKLENHIILSYEKTQSLRTNIFWKYLNFSFWFSDHWISRNSSTSVQRFHPRSFFRQYRLPKPYPRLYTLQSACLPISDCRPKRKLRHVSCVLYQYCCSDTKIKSCVLKMFSSETRSSMNKKSILLPRKLFLERREKTSLSYTITI